MEEPVFSPELHIKYWQRCQKTFLPNAYQSNDSSRIALAFFILSALEILGAGADTFSPKEREQYRDWILSCQHPSGGFCGSPTHVFPIENYGIRGEILVDPPNVTSTYFAVLSLALLGALQNVRRLDCLKHLKSLQREDGSFGEVLGKEGKIEGGRDMRYCHCASTIRWVLRGDKAPEVDINVEKLMQHICSGQTYDGGIAEDSEHEAHAGYTYCGIATLSSLGRLPETVKRKSLGAELDQSSAITELEVPDISALIQWLMSRQLDGGRDSGEGEEYPINGSPDESRLAGSLRKLNLDDPHSIGYNGRLNKPPDTCYSWWVAASMEILGEISLVDRDLTRRFLLNETQHRIGGFGKTPGDPPDIYHSYLGLATLAMMTEPGLKEVDAVLAGLSLKVKRLISNTSQTWLVSLDSYQTKQD